MFYKNIVLTFFLLIFGFGVTNLIAQEVEETEAVLREEAFTIPEIVTDKKRKIAQETGFSLVSGAGVLYGYDENVHRSPKEFENEGEFYGVWGLLRADKRFGEKNRLLSKLTYQDIRYAGNENANQNLGNLNNWFRTKLTENLNFEAGFRIRYRNDDATNIRGEEFNRDYSYWRYAADGALVWYVSEEHRLELGGEYMVKDYSETSGLNSIDWDQKTLRGAYRYRFGPFHYLRLRYSISEQNYDEEPASFKNNTEPPTNPPERHIFQRAQVWYSLPVNDKVDIDLGYSYKIKDDRFDDFESYDSHRIDAGLKWRLGTRKETEYTMGRRWARHFGVKQEEYTTTELRFGFAYTCRDFENRPADNGQTLEYTKVNLYAGFTQQLHESVWLFGNLNYYDRDTNKSTGILFRDYQGLVFSLGVGIYF